MLSKEKSDSWRPTSYCVKINLERTEIMLIYSWVSLIGSEEINVLKHAQYAWE